MASSSLISAAKVVCYVNGLPYAQVTSFQWSVTPQRKAIYGLDSGEPYELAPVTTKVTGSMAVLRTQKDGGLEGAGITAPLEELTREKYFSLTLVERTTNTILFRADQCSVQSQAWTVSPKSLVSGTVSFEAINWSNEAIKPQR